MRPLRSLLLRASESRRLGRTLPKMRFARAAVERFMPGENLDDALAACGRLPQARMSNVLSYLGENITDADQARDTAAEYLAALDAIAERRLNVELSVKLTQLGLDLDPALSLDHLRSIVHRAAEGDVVVWIDMEGSAYTDVTLEQYRAVRSEAANVGVCLQAYLHRTSDDVRALLPSSPKIRLVKGAYAEPPQLAFSRANDVRTNFERVARQFFSANGRGSAARLAVASHDTELIRRVQQAAREAGVPKDGFEFQLLYGIGRDVQQRLADEGYRVKVLISYGNAWFPWFMRRLAERPANLWFVARHLLG